MLNDIPLPPSGPAGNAFERGQEAKIQNLIVQLRHTLRAMRVAKRTEDAYLNGIARYLGYHRQRLG